MELVYCFHKQESYELLRRIMDHLRCRIPWLVSCVTCLKSRMHITEKCVTCLKSTYIREKTEVSKFVRLGMVEIDDFQIMGW